MERNEIIELFKQDSEYHYTGNGFFEATLEDGIWSYIYIDKSDVKKYEINQWSLNLILLYTYSFEEFIEEFELNNTKELLEKMKDTNDSEYEDPKEGVEFDQNNFNSDKMDLYFKLLEEGNKVREEFIDYLFKGRQECKKDYYIGCEVSDSIANVKKGLWHGYHLSAKIIHESMTVCEKRRVWNILYIMEKNKKTLESGDKSE